MHPIQAARRGPDQAEQHAEVIRDTERAKQQPQGGVGRERFLGHTEQIEKEHPVWEARPQGMGSANGKRGLSQPGRPGDEAHASGTWHVIGAHKIVGPGQFRSPAGGVVNGPG